MDGVLERPGAAEGALEAGESLRGLVDFAVLAADLGLGHGFPGLPALEQVVPRLHGPEKLRPVAHGDVQVALGGLLGQDASACAHGRRTGHVDQHRAEVVDRRLDEGFAEGAGPVLAESGRDVGLLDHVLADFLEPLLQEALGEVGGDGQSCLLDLCAACGGQAFGDARRERGGG